MLNNKEMKQKDIVKKTIAFVKKTLKNAEAGHDWSHVERVIKLAERINKKEKADPLTIKLAALLHDIADWKFHRGDDQAGIRLATAWLKKLKVKKGIIEKVNDTIKNISFKGAGVKNKPKSKEGQIVQDADRLDVLGAIGIARCFTFGGYKNRSLYNPKIKPKKHQSFQQYKNSKTTTINHFYEKLLLIKDRLNTKIAKKIAKDRHKFTQQFLERFLKEWWGKL